MVDFISCFVLFLVEGLEESVLVVERGEGKNGFKEGDLFPDLLVNGAEVVGEVFGEDLFR